MAIDPERSPLPELQESDLDIVTAFREVVLAGWASCLRPLPHGMRRAYHVGVIEDTVQLIPGKSLDSRPDGSSWLCSMDRILTPPSLADLGYFTVGTAVHDLRARLQNLANEILPYCICPATRSILLVQHKRGYSPTSAPFMFVGQRQEVEQTIAVPWNEAITLAENLPEAHELGPVLVVQMTGRCGSTVLTKAFEWLGVGCQSVSEPTVFADVHDMLERGLCTRNEAVRVLRASLLILIHQRRKAHPDKPIVVIKNRTLCPTWRSCELLPDAVPGVKQIFQWRTIEDVIGSFFVASDSQMISPSAQYLARRGMDGLLWHLNGRPVARWLERNVRILNGDPALALPGENSADLNGQRFISNGSLGFFTFMSMMDAHIAVAMGRKGLWSSMVQYEDLMVRKSDCVRDLLVTLGWMNYVPDPDILGTADANKVFLKDAHAGGGLSKGSGTTVGGNQHHLEATRVASLSENSGAVARVNAHLSHSQAEMVRALMMQHGPLQACCYDLHSAIAGRTGECPRADQDSKSAQPLPREGCHRIGGA